MKDLHAFVNHGSTMTVTGEQIFFALERDFHSNGHGSVTWRQRWRRTFELLFQNWESNLMFGREIGSH